MILAVIESFVLNFVLLLVCVMNIRNGAVGGVHYYKVPPCVKTKKAKIIMTK